MKTDRQFFGNRNAITREWVSRRHERVRIFRNEYARTTLANRLFRRRRRSVQSAITYRPVYVVNNNFSFATGGAGLVSIKTAASCGQRGDDRAY